MKLLKLKIQHTKDLVHNLENKIPDATTLSHINQYTDKQNLERNNEKKKKTVTSDLVTTLVFIIKISEFQSKGPNTSRLVTATVLNTKNSEFENTIPDDSKYITT